MSPTISASIITFNEAEHIAETVGSVSFCDEVVVVDSFSTDGTAEIAASLGAKVYKRPYKGTNDQKEYARTVSTGDWVLEIDGDEVAEPEVAAQAGRAVAEGGHAAYSFRFRTFIAGHEVRYGIHRAERHVRLFKKSACRYDTTVEPHNRLIVCGTVGKLPGIIVHHAMDDLGEAKEKSDRYARLAGESMAARGKIPNFLNPVLNPAWRFFKDYILDLGFLDGKAGYSLARISAGEVRKKYLIAGELSRKRPGQRNDPG
jgi:glycosyltransferase involved in cell wall biosynthesis